MQASGLSMRRGWDVILSHRAEVAELADAPALGAGGRKAVGVRVPSSAHQFSKMQEMLDFMWVQMDSRRGTGSLASELMPC
jgi:hypothetical protein